MPRTGKPEVFLLAALLCWLPVSGAFALRTERLARFAPASGKTSYMEVAGGVASVKFSSGVSTSAAGAALAAAGFSLSGRPPLGGWYLVNLPEAVSVSRGLSALKGFSFVAQAEPDKVYRAKKVPDDPYLSRQYALPLVQAFGAWEYETGASSRVTVAVIDSGIEGTHPEFAGKFSDSVSQFCDPGGNKDIGTDNSSCVAQAPTQACFHGTAVAGVAAAGGDNAIGVAGLSWGAKLVSMKVFRDADCPDDCGSTACGTDDWAMADALSFLAAKHNNASYGKIVANLSVGCPGCDCLGPMQTGVDTAVAAGMLIFAAAGNGADAVIDSPSNCSGVIAVGATDAQDKLASFSSTDSTMAVKGLTAPGVAVYTTDLNGGYSSVSGTSFSSPLAAGLAALLWSAKPSYTAAQIFGLMKNSADDLGTPGPDRSFGWGRINALKAMRLALPGAKGSAGSGKAAAYPNPFRPKTQRLVSFTLSDALVGAGLEVKIYTSEGELVKKLTTLAWDGSNEAGAAVASGVYLFRVKTDKDSAVGKFALIR